MITCWMAKSQEAPIGESLGQVTSGQLEGLDLGTLPQCRCQRVLEQRSKLGRGRASRRTIVQTNSLEGLFIWVCHTDYLDVEPYHIHGYNTKHAAYLNQWAERPSRVSCRGCCCLLFLHDKSRACMDSHVSSRRYCAVTMPKAPMPPLST